MKTLNESFTDQEFAELKEIKDELGLNWHDFILTVPKNLSREQRKSLADFIKRNKEEVKTK